MSGIAFFGGQPVDKDLWWGTALDALEQLGTLRRGAKVRVASEHMIVGVSGDAAWMLGPASKRVSKTMAAYLAKHFDQPCTWWWLDHGGHGEDCSASCERIGPEDTSAPVPCELPEWVMEGYSTAGSDADGHPIEFSTPLARTKESKEMGFIRFVALGAESVGPSNWAMGPGEQILGVWRASRSARSSIRRRPA